jgi:hypothetical protein
MDEDMEAIDAGGLELERRLDAYARGRLSPDPRAVARVRARVLREARLQADAVRIAAHVAPALASSRRPLLRRVAMPMFAATVWLGIAVGTIAAAQAGGPLYPTRLLAEQALLPASGASRVDADLGHLDDRVSEALRAATRGDTAALSAALTSYAAIADDAQATSDGDDALAGRVQDALSRHQAVLTALAAGFTADANDAAAAAIARNVQRAIDRTAAVLATLTSHRGGGGGSGATTGGGTTNAGDKGGGTGSGAGTSGAGGGAGGGNGGAAGSGGAGAGGQGGGNGAGNGGGTDPTTEPGANPPKPTQVPDPSAPSPGHTPRAGG